MFGEPFSKKLIDLIAPLVEKVILTLPADAPKPKLHVNKTAVVMEG
jgi:5'-methylthioadenosine phosphorylase